VERSHASSHQWIAAVTRLRGVGVCPRRFDLSPAPEVTDGGRHWL
jgi:hypothetical protein